MFESFQNGDRGGDAGRLLERFRGMMEQRGGRKGARRGGDEDEDEGNGDEMDQWRERAQDLFEQFQGGRGGDEGRGFEDLARRGMEEFQNLPPDARKQIEKLLGGDADGLEGVIERFRGAMEQRGGRKGARRGNDEDDEESEDEDEDEGNGDEMNQWRERAQDLFEQFQKGNRGGDSGELRERALDLFEQFQKGDRGGEAGKLLERFRGMMEERRGGRHDEDEDEEEDEDEDEDDGTLL